MRIKNLVILILNFQNLIDSNLNKLETRAILSTLKLSKFKFKHLIEKFMKKFKIEWFYFFNLVKLLKISLNSFSSKLSCNCNCLTKFNPESFFSLRNLEALKSKTFAFIKSMKLFSKLGRYRIFLHKTTAL